MKRSTVPAALLGFVLLAPLTLTLAPPPAEAAITALQGTYHGVTTSRILDTRQGVGAPVKPVAAKGTLSLQVGGRGGVPTSGVAAVVVNVTVTKSTATTAYLTLYPSTTASGTAVSRPKASTINFTKGLTTASTTTVPVGKDGKVKIFNSAGTTEVIVDVVGWYAGTSKTATGATDYLSLEPERVTDTRDREQYEGALPARYQLDSGIDFGTPELNADVRSLAVKITAVNPKRSGYLTAWDGTRDLPTIAALHFQATTTVANTAIVKARACGSECVEPTARVFTIYNGSSSSVDVVVDVVGVYVDTTTRDASALRFLPVAPTRIIDSRVSKKPLTARATRTVSAGRVATAETATLVTTTTVVAPTAKTYLTVWATGPRPTSSSLNAPAKRTVASAVNADLTGANTFQVYNSAGTTDFVIDVTGKFDFAPYFAPDPSATTAARAQAVRARRSAPAVITGGRFSAR